jgi:hypothetical protein
MQPVKGQFKKFLLFQIVSTESFFLSGLIRLFEYEFHFMHSVFKQFYFWANITFFFLDQIR